MQISSNEKSFLKNIKMDRRVISFSEISNEYEEKIREFKEMRVQTLIFNGCFLRKTLDETIYVLEMLKRYGIIPIENHSCSELEFLLFDRESIESIEIFEKTLEVGTKNYKKLKNAVNYYRNNKVKYLIIDRILYLGNIVDLREGIENMKIIQIENNNFPVDEEILEMFKESEYDVDKIVLPLNKFTDYGFCTIIGKYEIISTTVKKVKHSPKFGKRSDLKPVCFYDGHEIFGISSYKINYSYKPQEISVCIFENVDNEEVIFFKLFSAKKISVWFDLYRGIIISTSKNSTPLNLIEYTLEEILLGQYVNKQEEFQLPKKNSVIHSPVCSPTEN